ncbi:hypothetical protein GCM10011571_35060 [Marinithermofilum abyssi]|uniref:Uncharacterized protein n=1 Tax=Marinithermofilum abyssi TaxID=1571185 RepID=A0A8J2VL76_9BACL|nr:hypothetical protein GCM10011571_35060 [Marinithermofilum abyssi]
MSTRLDGKEAFAPVTLRINGHTIPWLKNYSEVIINGTWTCNALSGGGTAQPERMARKQCFNGTPTEDAISAHTLSEDDALPEA